MQKIYQTDIKTAELTLPENCDVVNEDIYIWVCVCQLHWDVLPALLSVKRPEVMKDMKMKSRGVFFFFVQYIFSINKITVNKNK